MFNHDCTGRSFPWVYSRTWVGETTLQVDCISPKEISVGNTLTIRMPHTIEEKTMQVKSIEYFRDAPVKMFDKDLQNCYYKLNLTYLL